MYEQCWSWGYEHLIGAMITFDWGYDHSTEEEKSFQNQLVPVQLVPFFYEISGTSWFFFFSGVIIASVEGDHSPSKVFIASWSTLFMHEILCMKMIIAMNCCCSCMIFWIMAMKDYWSWMISTDRCIISWPLQFHLYSLPQILILSCWSNDFNWRFLLLFWNKYLSLQN